MSAAGFLERLLDGADVEWVPLGDENFFEIANTARRPVKASLRAPGKIPYYGANNIQDYVEGHTHNGEYVLIAEDGSASLDSYSIQYARGKFWANNHVHVVRGTNVVDTRFLFHYLTAANFLPFLSSKGRAKLTKGRLVEIPVPIPCPEDRKKSLAIQGEIVRILDSFTELTVELIAKLTAELTARKKQHVYYRDQLLTFDEDVVEWKTLEGLIETVTPPAKVKSDVYRLMGAKPIIDQGAAYIAGYTDEDIASLPRDEYIIFGDHSEHIKFVDFSFIQGADGLKILTAKDVCPKFLYYAFQICYVKEGNYKRHWSKAKETKIPIPFAGDPEKSHEEQTRIVAILDNFDTLTTSLIEGLRREIELREKQYIYYRDLLLSFPKPDEMAA